MSQETPNQQADMSTDPMYQEFLKYKQMQQLDQMMAQPQRRSLNVRNRYGGPLVLPDLDNLTINSGKCKRWFLSEDEANALLHSPRLATAIRLGWLEILDDDEYEAIIASEDKQMSVSQDYSIFESETLDDMALDVDGTFAKQKQMRLWQEFQKNQMNPYAMATNMVVKQSAANVVPLRDPVNFTRVYMKVGQPMGLSVEQFKVMVENGQFAQEAHRILGINQPMNASGAMMQGGGMVMTPNGPMQVPMGNPNNNPQVLQHMGINTDYVNPMEDTGGIYQFDALSGGGVGGGAKVNRIG